MKLINLVVLANLIFWPFSLALANTRADFVRYILPTTLIAISFFLYVKNVKKHLYLIPLVFIGIFEPKLVLFPVIFFVFNAIIKKNKTSVVFLFTSLLIFTSFIKSFLGQSVFSYDYEARQEVIRNTQLYPTVFLARLFHNKARIPLEKISSNFFSLIDPGNYFFDSQPIPVPSSQNLTKFPFLGIIFLLYGIYFLRRYKHRKFILLIIVSLLVSLTLLTNYDRQDFALWLPVALIITHGVSMFEAKKYKFKNIFYFVFLVFATVAILRILVQHYDI